MTSRIIRRMVHGDLAHGLKLTQAQNWAHRLEDWEFHFQLGQGWVACDAQGSVIGTASWWAYDEAFGTVGLIVVDPSYQGQGIGRELLHTVMKDAGPRTLQLIATQAGFKLYQQNGFQEQGGIGQYQGIPQGLSAGPTPHAPSGTTLRPVRPEDLPALIAADYAALGASRRNVIAAVFNARDSGIIAENRGAVTGFSLARQSGGKTVIGPVVATDEALAMALISQQLETTDGVVRIDAPTSATQLVTWLDAVGLPCVDRVTMMVRGTPPAPRGNLNIFSLISQALS